MGASSPELDTSSFRTILGPSSRNEHRRLRLARLAKSLSAFLSEMRIMHFGAVY